jgi:hypothetical protein
MAGIGKKIKEAATKAAKDKIYGDKKGNKDKPTRDSESGVNKAKRAVTNRLK